jgi:hypothetical protein
MASRLSRQHDPPNHRKLLMFKLIVIGMLATATAVSAQTQVAASRSIAFYATPSVVIAFPGDFDRAAGGALALGATINNVHSIEAEVMSFKTNESSSEDFTFTPVLATYKYTFVLNGKISLMAGASLGATFEKTEYFVGPFPGIPPDLSGGHYRISETAFTSGLLGGITYVLNSRVSLDANAHVLRLEETDVTTAGSMVLITLGVKVRF